MMKPSFLLVLVTLALFTSEAVNAQKISCVDMNSKPVDWFVIFLLPETKSYGSGIQYSYADSSNQSFKLYDVDDESFPPLALVRSMIKSTSNLVWNDDQSSDHEHSYSESKAHSKGFIAYEKDGGFQLLHSLPRFPHLSDNGEFLATLPGNAGEFGQHFLCLSLTAAQAEKMTDTVQIIKPNFYDKSQSKKSKDKKRKDSLKTVKGLSIDIFLKAKADLLPWEGTIQDFYETGFYVETWTRPHILDNECDKGRETFGVISMKINNVCFENSNDHSKWGVSVDGKVACFGDLNRTASQEKRSGMVMCMQNAKIAGQVLEFIYEYTSCPGKTLKFLQ